MHESRIRMQTIEWTLAVKKRGCKGKTGKVMRVYSGNLIKHGVVKKVSTRAVLK